MFSSCSFPVVSHQNHFSCMVDGSRLFRSSVRSVCWRSSHVAGCLQRTADRVGRGHGRGQGRDGHVEVFLLADGAQRLCHPWKRLSGASLGAGAADERPEASGELHNTDKRQRLEGTTGFKNFLNEAKLHFVKVFNSTAASNKQWFMVTKKKIDNWCSCGQKILQLYQSLPKIQHTNNQLVKKKLQVNARWSEV